MNNGLFVSETIGFPIGDVWAYLIDFSHASAWITGVEQFKNVSGGQLGVESKLAFIARGKEQVSVVTAFEPGKRIDLTTTRSGITAVHSYTLAPQGDGTIMTLDATCETRGLWKFIHPIITYAMKKGGSSHLSNISTAMKKL